MHDEARPDQSGVAEHHREQPDDALDAGLVGKFDNELREVDLRLLAGRRLEADLKAGRPRRPQIAHQVGDRRVAALISALLELAPQAAAVRVGNAASRSRKYGSNGSIRRGAAASAL